MDYFGLFSNPSAGEQDDSGPFAKLFPQSTPKQPLPDSFNASGDPNPLVRAILKDPDYKSPLDMESPPAGAAIAPPSLALAYPPHFARQALVDVLRPYLDASQFVGGAISGVEPATAANAITKLGGAALATIVPPGARGASATERAAATLRELPADNYLKPLSQYASKLWRETSPEDALYALPHSNSSIGYGLGAPRQFYADTPELALGQGANKGVRIEYDAAPFQGTINKKPGWEPLFQRGNAEYLAEPMRGKDTRAAINSFEINKTELANSPRHVQSRFDLLSRKLKENGWDMTDNGKSIIWKRLPTAGEP